jgi:lipopolysaccharide transport system ATP-binding protein
MHQPNESLAAAPATVALRAENLGKSYRIFSSPKHRLKQTLLPSSRNAGHEFWALRELTLDVPRGQTLGVIGRNGSGKSTLLQLLCKTLTPTTGSLSTVGRIAAILELGAGFHPEFTGRENIRLAAQLHGLTPRQIDDRLDAIIHFADLGGGGGGDANFIDQPVKTYSSGMFVRLAFSIIAHVDADILLIDEALAVGDVFFVQKCFRFLREFQTAGKTIVLVSHDAAALQSLCHQVLWLDQGRRHQLGPPKEILQNYLAAAHGFPRHIAPGLPGVTVPDSQDSTSTAYGARGATIHSVTLTDEHQNPITALTTHTPATLTIRATAHRPLAGIILGFFLKDRLGQNIFGDNTAATHPNLAANTGDPIIAQFQFTMPTLPAGQYTLTAAIAEGSQHDHQIQHWLHDALTLTSLTRNDALGLVGIPMTTISMDIGTSTGDACAMLSGAGAPLSMPNVLPLRRIGTEVPMVLLTPELLSDYSAWIPHIPFAFTLIDLLRPRTFVELGTHKGDSYCAFCQAIRHLQLNITATAVDTWTGDSSAGFYDASILQQLKAHHDPRYSSSSTLLQSTFDDAASRFANNSIDLLHIDGSHDYASVKHDFETWLPKLSRQCVVLLHDTQVTANNFGVHHLFTELKSQFPHFEFPHAYGLGLLVTGKSPPQPLLDFLDQARQSPAEIQQLYAALGERLESQRILNLLTQQLSSQTTLTRNWRRTIGADPLPPFPDPANLADRKLHHDQLARHAAALTGDLNHLLNK